MTGRTHGGRFPPGISGNPGGTPRSAEVAALARRYTMDAVRAYVWASRLRDPKYAGAAVAASKELIALGYGKGDEGNAVVHHLHKHLLAVSAAQGGPQAVVVSAHMTGEPDQAAIEAAVDEWLDTPGLYHEPDDVPPGAALPLWETEYARRPVIEAKAEPNVAINPTDEAETIDPEAKIGVGGKQ
jgi:hypothetical protein